MIVSASRRTDVPAFFADWFFERLDEGFVLVANPFNARQVRRVELGHRAVDGFVFWTKDPGPMLDRLERLAGYPFYFHCTLTGCRPELEPGLPPKPKVVQAMLRLAEATAPRQVMWRFDPMLFGGAYTPEYHAEAFSQLARQLCGYVDGCIFSFYSPYAAAERRLRPHRLRPPTEAEKAQTAALLSAEAARLGLPLYSCAESTDLATYGIGQAACVDAGRLSAIGGRCIAAAKDKNQRPGCGCAASVDIGSYGSCPGGCLYCYATRRG